ncbi:unnamed protein product, partial [Mycena citricolor]
RDGRSGIKPSGPSITGLNGTCSLVSAKEVSSPSRSSCVVTFRRHENVKCVFAKEAQEGTPATKLVQIFSRRVAGKIATVACDPDSKIYGIRTAARANLSTRLFKNKIDVRMLPALCPNAVTLRLSPPNLPMFR